jgi:hypothetical protein
VASVRLQRDGFLLDADLSGHLQIAITPSAAFEQHDLPVLADLNDVVS